ncbi:sugar phosphate nucleotidyltransferase [Flexilinea flocculi]|jgi:glucose-1-phosphate thymidylyltransferase|nr:sugar phosphate nucleotidyltransferase [Flexilinea flocculi]
MKTGQIEIMKKHIQIVIPMAGFGSRLRPLTWSKPKPLIDIAGKTSLDYLLSEFSSLNQDFEQEFIFIIAPNGWQIKSYMESHYPDVKCRFVVQEEMKGQSHAIYLARELIHGPMLMTFSDTIIEGDLSFLANEKSDGIAWVQWNPEPQRFGVAITDPNNQVERFIEKPATDEHKLVIVGFYYFSEGKDLIAAIEEQISKNISLKNEYYIADAINVMIQHGAKFRTEETKLWLDTGVPETVLSSNQYFLDHGNDNSSVASQRKSVAIIPPVFIAEDAIIEHACIGPYVSIAGGCEIRNAVIENTIIAEKSVISNIVMKDSMVGTKAQINNHSKRLFIGDNSITGDD